MTTPVTARELEAMQARTDAATKGPWFLVPLPWRRRDMPSYVNAGSEDPHGGVPVLNAIGRDEFTDDFTEEDWIAQADNDLDFAANARTDLPRLLAVAQAARAAGRAFKFLLDLIEMRSPGQMAYGDAEVAAIDALAALARTVEIEG